MMSDLSFKIACTHAQQSEQIKGHVSQQSSPSALNKVVQRKYSTSFQQKGAYKPGFKREREKGQRDHKAMHSGESACDVANNIQSVNCPVVREAITQLCVILYMSVT